MAQERAILRVMAQQRRLNWTDNPPVDWGEREAHRISIEVKRLRGKKSAQWLADRTKDLGYEVSRSVISDLENGRRRYVTTAELIVLAVALDTSPVMLVYPGPYGDELVEAIPGIKASKFIAAEWFSGITWFGVAEKSGDDPVARWDAAVDELTLNRRLADLERQRTQAHLDALGAAATPENLSLHQSRIRLLDDAIRDVRLRLEAGHGDA